MNYGSSYNFTYILLNPGIVALKRGKSDKEIISVSCDMTLSEFYLTEYFFYSNCFNINEKFSFLFFFILRNG